MERLRKILSKLLGDEVWRFAYQEDSAQIVAMVQRYAEPRSAKHSTWWRTKKSSPFISRIQGNNIQLWHYPSLGQAMLYQGEGASFQGSLRDRDQGCVLSGRFGPYGISRVFKLIWIFAFAFFSVMFLGNVIYQAALYAFGGFGNPDQFLLSLFMLAGLAAFAMVSALFWTVMATGSKFQRERLAEFLLSLGDLRE